ncbi:LL-diaminopimelate aminotransferase [candidate division KSB3 bacterium]|uniref:Aminotransferase n=1 Tax=candidate division KSB3 bacterium TaxID=2044937 RepID=A0A2G6E1W9_9BACT|nr:MAG: LL-diaminopimelate aminotransferase [candidate division KSB3 bacterium]PIE28783.1 MAG: LL-diaminopimelate aminotransferase [candidate division KSB3 bacterium]
MIQVNANYAKLQRNYLFAEIAEEVGKYQAQHPDKAIIKLGIGDVTKALTPGVLAGLRKGVEDMANADTFHGYGPYEGYTFLREKIVSTDFVPRNVDILPEEIFISTGAKEDSANFQEIFAADTRIAIPDPVYPVYIDSNVMAGRTGDCHNGHYEGVVYLDSTAENNFLPALPQEDVDLIYLCYPNNPTGQVATKEVLKKWVEYAHEKKALLLFDAAYEAFIRDDQIPHSIFELDGARDVAVEFRSLSKTAGFTGTRLAYTIIPNDVKIYDAQGNPSQLNQVWLRRQSTKFNGVAYIIQKGAEAAFTPEGRQEINAIVDYYLENARIIREGLDALNISYSGGVNAPYIWLKTPDGLSSWDMFHKLLHECQVVGTPGSGFGKCGEGYFRLSAFGNTDDVQEAISRLSDLEL